MAELYTHMLKDENIKLAIKFTIDQVKRDIYYNPIQHSHCVSNIDQYVERIKEKLYNYESFETKEALRAIKHKNAFAIRNIIILDIDDIIIRTVFCLALANHLEEKLIENCFSYRRGEQVEKNTHLFEDFATHGWQRFCDWQSASVKKYRFLLKTDISSFFDSISHEYVVSALIRELSLPEVAPEVILLRKILKIRHRLYCGQSSKEVSHGITIGTFSNHVIPNLLLNSLDHCMAACPGISYGRYVDDIRIFANSTSRLTEVLELLQTSLYEIGLNLNGAKTEFAGDPRLLKKMMTREVNEYSILNWDEDEILPNIELDIQLSNKFKESLLQHINVPLNTIDNASFATHPRVILSDSKKAAKFLHELNRRLNEDPHSIRRSNVIFLLKLLERSYHNEKYTVWLLFCVIFRGTFTVKSRVMMLAKILNMISKKRVSFYVMSRFFALMGSRQRLIYFRYTDLDPYLQGRLYNSLTKALSVYISSGTEYSLIISKFFVEDFNKYSHKRQIDIESLKLLMLNNKIAGNKQ